MSNHTAEDLVKPNTATYKSIREIIPPEQLEKPGRFFRYMDAESALQLFTSGKIVFDSERAFAAFVSSKKFNPTGEIPAEALITIYVLRAINAMVQHLPLELQIPRGQEHMVVTSEYAQNVEAFLSKADTKYLGLVRAISAAIKDSSLQPIIDFFRIIGGDRLLKMLKRAGMGTAPFGYFSDLMPVSVGAPLGVPDNDATLLFELDFDDADLVVPEDDRLNEHELLVREIRLDAVRGIYNSSNSKELFDRLKARFPQHFPNGTLDELAGFAELPMQEVLNQVGL